MIGDKRCHFVITPEMEAARARLEAYKNKVQPYPLYPEMEHDAPQSKSEPLKSSVTPIPPPDQFQQLKSHVLYLQNKLNFHLDKSFRKRKAIEPF